MNERMKKRPFSMLRKMKKKHRKKEAKQKNDKLEAQNRE